MTNAPMTNMATGGQVVADGGRRTADGASVEVLIIAPISDAAFQKVQALGGTLRHEAVPSPSPTPDPRPWTPVVTVVDGRWTFEAEYRESWPPFTARRYLPPQPDPRESLPRAERDRLLATAEVVLGTFPFPRDLRARAPRLRWFHQIPAGASNLRWGDLWGSDVTVTTSRGLGNTLPMAEYVLAAIMYFIKGFHRVAVDRARCEFDHREYRARLLRGKTVCVIGLGGIGRAVARLCAAAGMRVVGTRRRVAPGDSLPEGVSRMESAEGLHALLAESDFVAVCCQLTAETEGLIGRAAVAAMKPGAVLVNVARGEIVDEAALRKGLASGKLAGAALDVYRGEFEGPPDRALWDDPRVLITPHTSAETDLSLHRGVDLFCENLTRYLAGRPLENLVDWERGY
jgi:phosphoglycerate dehydrogenase-like enzyme